MAKPDYRNEVREINERIMRFKSIVQRAQTEIRRLRDERERIKALMVGSKTDQ